MIYYYTVGIVSKCNLDECTAIEIDSHEHSTIFEDVAREFYRDQNDYEQDWPFTFTVFDGNLKKVATNEVYMSLNPSFCI